MNTNVLYNKIKENLISRHGEEIKQIILFGSRVDGNARMYSDYDFLIVLKNSYDWKKKDLILETICDLNIQFDIIIDAHIISNEELHSLRGKQPFIQHALSTGLSL